MFDVSKRNIIGTNREKERQMFGFWGAGWGGKRKKGGEEVECPEILEMEADVYKEVPSECRQGVREIS